MIQRSYTKVSLESREREFQALYFHHKLTLRSDRFHAQQAIEYGNSLLEVHNAWYMHYLMSIRHKRSWRNKSQKSRGNTLGEACICQSQRCGKRDGSHSICYLRTVKNARRTYCTAADHPIRPPLAAKGIEEAIEAEIPLVVWYVRVLPGRIIIR